MWLYVLMNITFLFRITKYYTPAAGLPISLPRDLPVSDLLRAMSVDKKNQGGHKHLVMLHSIGQVCTKDPSNTSSNVELQYTFPVLDECLAVVRGWMDILMNNVGHDKLLLLFDHLPHEFFLFSYKCLISAFVSFDSNCALSTARA